MENIVTPVLCQIYDSYDTRRKSKINHLFELIQIQYIK